MAGEREQMERIVALNGEWNRSFLDLNESWCAACVSADRRWVRHCRRAAVVGFFVGVAVGYVAALLVWRAVT
jgi:hypothetical protein